MLTIVCSYSITEILEPRATCLKATTKIPEQLQLIYLFLRLTYFIFSIVYIVDFEPVIVSWNFRKTSL